MHLAIRGGEDTFTGVLPVEPQSRPTESIRTPVGLAAMIPVGPQEGTTSHKRDLMTDTSY
jgi:hypothetical protein